VTKPGPSKEYRDLVEGRITPEEYVRKLKKAVNERLGISEPREPRERSERAAAA
jgi:hypothetical protein